MKVAVDATAVPTRLTGAKVAAAWVLAGLAACDDRGRGSAPPGRPGRWPLPGLVPVAGGAGRGGTAGSDRLDPAAGWARGLPGRG